MSILQLHGDYSKPVHITLLSNEGKMALQESLLLPGQIDTKNLDSGAYHYIVRDAHSTLASGRLIKH